MPDATKTAAPKAQTFNFKESETQVLQILQDANIAVQRSFAALLSLIASDRLGYKVSEVTQFKLNDQLTSMETSEHPELLQKPDVPTTTAPAGPPKPPETPKSGAVAAA